MVFPATGSCIPPVDVVYCKQKFHNPARWVVRLAKVSYITRQGGLYSPACRVIKNNRNKPNNMAAKYDFLSIPNPKDGGKTRILYPKLVTNGTVSWEQLVHEIASESSFEPGTVVGVMTEIERRVLHHLSYGYRVQVGGMCYAEASLQADREIKAENEIHAQSIHFGKINLQPAFEFPVRRQSGACRPFPQVPRKFIALYRRRAVRTPANIFTEARSDNPHAIQRTDGPAALERTA